MPRTAITPVAISRTAYDRSTISATTGDAVNGHSVANAGRMWLEVTNTNGASTARTLTVHLPGSFDGQTVTPRTYSIAAGATMSIGPWPPESYSGSLLLDVDNAELHIAAFLLA